MIVGARVAGLIGLLGMATLACGGDEKSPGAGSAGSSASGSGGAAAGGGSDAQAGAAHAGSAAAGAGGAATSAPSTKLEACLNYVKEFCAFTYQCAGRSDPSVCESTLDRECPDLFFSDGSTRTVAGLNACVATWKTLSCADYAQGVAPNCISPGTRAVGEACVFPSQCSGLACSAHMTCGTCGVTAAPGGACDESTQCPGGQDCDAGLCVNGKDVSNRGMLGASCDPAHPCGADSDCSGGVCTALPAAGAACSPEGSCAQGVFCDDQTQQCRVPPNAGQPCLTYLGNMLCAEQAYCVNGNCVALPGPGQPCTPSGACAPDSWCQNPGTAPVCRARGSTPDCESDGQCAPGSICSDKLCKPLVAFHAACDADHVCSAQASCSNGRCEPLETLGLFAARCN